MKKEIIQLLLQLIYSFCCSFSELQYCFSVFLDSLQYWKLLEILV